MRWVGLRLELRHNRDGQNLAGIHPSAPDAASCKGAGRVAFRGTFSNADESRLFLRPFYCHSRLLFRLSLRRLPTPTAASGYRVCPDSASDTPNRSSTASAACGSRRATGLPLDWVDLLHSRHTLLTGMAGSLAAVGRMEDCHHTKCLEGRDPSSSSWASLSARLKRPMMPDRLPRGYISSAGELSMRNAPGPHFV